MFFFFLFLIFAALLGSGIWAITSKDTLKKSVTDTLRRAVHAYESDPSSKTLMDSVQGRFDCCGADRGAADYAPTRRLAPDTCKLINYARPCDKMLFNYFSDNLVIIAGVAIGIGIVMLLGMVFSMMLCCAIREAVA